MTTKFVFNYVMCNGNNSNNEFHNNVLLNTKDGIKCNKF